MTEKQKTIKENISVAGVGLHTGKKVTINFKPAPENHGIKFKRIDLHHAPEVEALIDNVVDTSRGTTLEKNGAQVMTIEHTLAAVAGTDIDNLLIEIDGLELPILDGSSKFYVEALLKAGVIEQDAEREYFELKTNLSYTDPDNKVEMLAIPSDSFRLSVMIDYDSDILISQHASLDNINNFKDEIACSRTFVFLHELEYLIQNDLVKGGDLSNAIVFVDKIISQEELDRLAKFFNRPKVKVLKEGILNNIELFHPNEPARHKLLDIIGDLSLIGTRIKGQIIAKRPGHYSNIEFARLIKSHIKKQMQPNRAPSIDLNKPPVYDINDIKKFLPHRPPFLLVDKIMEINDTQVIAVKNVTMNEPFFVGHFPNEPLMPGVLQVEAMAQAGGILVLSNVDNPKEWDTYFLKIENARFRHKVVPGDTLVFKLDMIFPIRRGICQMHGVAYVGDKIVTEADLMAQIVKKEK